MLTLLSVEGQNIEITLSNGTTLSLLMPTISPPVKKADCIKNYGNLILELGLLLKDLLDLSQMPERQRGLSLLKMAMLFFKSHKNLSKYAYEILRLLVHQICTLSEQEACEEYYGMFVNTNGKYNGHIPADKRMEYLVKQIKEHIKHMASNKTEGNIKTRTRAISGIREVAENFDSQSHVVIRSKKHTNKSSRVDEIAILDELRKVRPFLEQPGRQFISIKNVQPSIVNNLNILHYHQWIESRKSWFALDLGN